MTPFNTKYDAEAREIIRASSSEPAIRHAITSLHSLRDSFDQLSRGSRHEIQQTPSFYYGLRQYNKALVALARKLSEAHSNSLRSTLLCCQLFISIELRQTDYVSATQHFIRGFKIMYDAHPRPAFNDMGNLIMKGEHYDLPKIDVFALKFFIPPCWRTYEIPHVSKNNTILTDAIHQYHNEIVSLAEATLRLLNNISRISCIEDGLTLLKEKERLLKCGQHWYMSIKILLKQFEVAGMERPHPSFLFFCHFTLKVITTMALSHSQKVLDSLDSEFDNMIMISQNLAEEYGDAAFYNVLGR